jgi:hypothetical protein
MMRRPTPTLSALALILLTATLMAFPKISQADDDRSNTARDSEIVQTFSLINAERREVEVDIDAKTGKVLKVDKAWF